jgi:hypothetical protein
MRLSFGKLMAGVAFLGIAGGAALAQWSILAPGKREAKPGNHRYAYLVFANPVPGREVEFNDWYQNMHMGDLVQHPGWIGAQRFRIVVDVKPKPTEAGYTQGYLIIWDQEDPEPGAIVQRNRPSPAWGFADSPTMTYEALGTKITREDGKGPTLVKDKTSVRPFRYILMDHENPLPGKEAEFGKAMDQEIKQVLALPGWLAAQRFVLVHKGQGEKFNKAQYLTIWETEGVSAPAVNDTLMQAKKSGAVAANPAADTKGAEMVYWEPISPFITKDDFER